jgi:hypothetical protein
MAGRGMYRFAIVASKIIAMLCLIAGVGYGAVYLISPWMAARRLSRVDPLVNDVPQSLQNKTQAPLSNLSVDLYGFRLLLPNQRVEELLKSEQFTTVRLRNGVLMIRNSSHDDDWIVSESVQNSELGKDLLGPDLRHSHYKLMEASMSATPDQVKWWRFRSKENQRSELLVMTKFFELTQIHSASSAKVCCLYKIEFGEFRGFQFGSPEVAPYNVHVDVFDAADRHFQFEIFGSDGHGPILTQSEVNAMVGSIQHIQPPATLHIENIEEH